VALGVVAYLNPTEEAPALVKEGFAPKPVCPYVYLIFSTLANLV
jgi:hypothetical protein